MATHSMVFLPGKPHGQRSLADHSHKESPRLMLLSTLVITCVHLCWQGWGQGSEADDGSAMRNCNSTLRKCLN